MKKRMAVVLGLLVLFSMSGFCLSAEKANAGPSDHLLITGTVNNSQGKVLKEEKGDLLVVSDEGRGFAEKVLFGERLPHNIKELERRAGVPVKVIQ